MIKKKVVIVDYLGCGNVGDDAHLAGLLKIFSQDVWDITVFASDHQYISRHFDVNTVKQQLNAGCSFHNVLHGFDIRAMVQAIRTTDVLLLSGALLHDATVYNLPYYFSLQSLAKILGKRVVYLGNGMGPISTTMGKYLTRVFLNHVDYISVRDQGSMELLKNAGVRKEILVTADAAFALSKTDVNESHLSKILHEESIPETFVSTTICAWLQSSNYWKRDALDLTQEIKRLAEIIDTIIARYDQHVVFIPMLTPHEKDMAQKIRSQMKYSHRYHIVQGEYGPLDIMGIIGRSQWLLGMRMHSMIFATIMHVPFFGMIYDPKVRDFLKITNNEHSFELDDLFSERIEEKIEWFVQEKEKFRTTLIETYAFLHSKVNEDYQNVLRGVINEG